MCSQNISSQLQGNLRGARSEEEATTDRHDRATEQGSLGIFTKSHVILATQGFQRLHEFLLQDQSAKLLPKERVTNCLKKRIDKQKQREVKYSK